MYVNVFCKVTCAWQIRCVKVQLCDNKRCDDETVAVPLKCRLHCANDVWSSLVWGIISLTFFRFFCLKIFTICLKTEGPILYRLWRNPQSRKPWFALIFAPCLEYNMNSEKSEEMWHALCTVHHVLQCTWLWKPVPCPYALTTLNDKFYLHAKGLQISTSRELWHL